MAGVRQEAMSKAESENQRPAFTSEVLEERRKLRARLMLAVILAQVVALLWLLPKDPIVTQRIGRLLNQSSSPSRDPNYEARLHDDPPLGVTISPLDGVENPTKTSAKPRSGYLVVPVGDCAGCISVDLRRWEQEAANHGLTMLLLTSAAPSNADRFRKESKLTSPIAFDPDGRLMKRLNPVWLGRAYLFSPNWRLVWIQREMLPLYNPFTDKMFLQALAGGS